MKLYYYCGGLPGIEDVTLVARRGISKPEIMDARRGMLPKMKMFARRGRMKRKILPARRGMSKPEIVKAGHGMLPKMRVIEAEDLFARRGMLNSMNRATSKKERNQEEEREEEFSFSIYTNSRSTANAARC